MPFIETWTLFSFNKPQVKYSIIIYIHLIVSMRYVLTNETGGGFDCNSLQKLFIEML